MAGLLVTRAAISEPAHVTIVNSTLHVGGAERVAACLATHLDRGTFQVTACYLKENGSIGEQMAEAGVDLVPIPELVVGKRDYFSALKLRRLILDRRIDLIHTHDVHSFIDGAICRLIIPGLRHVHTFHFGNYPNREPRYVAIERLLWRVPDALVAVGYAQAKSIKALYGIPDDRIQVIYNGVEPSRAVEGVALLEDVRRRGDPVICSISTLIEQKGIRFLLDAAALLRDSGELFQLVIAGDGGLRASLIEHAAAKGLSDRVHFLGWVKQAPDRLLPDCDIFVQSSLWEAMSVVVLEAMAAAKPLVATRVGENPAIVVDGHTGVLIPPADTPALAEGIRRLLRDPELRRAMGQKAAEAYAERFSVGHMVAAHERLYQRLVAG